MPWYAWTFLLAWTNVATWWVTDERWANKVRRDRRKITVGT